MNDITPETIAKAADGDVTAFEQVYRALCGFVYSVSLRVTNNKEDAQEVTQDVFIRLHKNLKSFQFKSQLKTWVYRITVNTALNACKKRSRHAKNEQGDYDIAISTASVPGQMEKKIEQEDNTRRVARLLDALNPDQRACIVLREMESMDYKEISDVLKININTVRSRLKRARTALMAIRQKRGEENGLR